MSVYPILTLDLKFTADSWDFALSEREGIEAYWAKLKAATPDLWNGDVLMCSEATIAGTTLTARFFQSDFASLVAWRDWGWPRTRALNCFGSAAVLSSDGALLYGRMAAHTLNSGRVYPPGGSLEPNDVLADGRVDVPGSIARELAEETGLNVREAEDSGFVAVFDERNRVGIAQLLRFPLTSAQISQRVRDFLGADPKAELADIVMLERGSQADATMPEFAQELARYLLRAE
jgi:8-oxo-dGTP pyrophosphatase MutT (NUDIX family)